jgi:hypothetical protein
MKKAFIISWLLGFFVWPAVMIGAVMLTDQPEVPFRTGVLRQVAAYSAFLAPIVWVVALILAILEARKDKRPRVLRAYAVAPYAAAGIHVLALVALFTLAA